MAPAPLPMRRLRAVSFLHVPELAEGRPYPLLGLVRYARVVVQGPGHGHGADARQRGHIAHRRYGPLDPDRCRRHGPGGDWPG